MDFDLTVFNALHGLAGNSGIVDGLIIFLADYLGYFLIIGFFWILWKEKNIRQRLRCFLFTGLVVILSRGILTEIIRFIYDRPRPFEVLNFTSLINHAVGRALPSGHAAFYFALSLAILFCYSHRHGYSFRRNPGWLFLVIAGLTAVSRVIAGVHWPLDILAGLAVAFASVLVIKYLLVFSNR